MHRELPALTAAATATALGQVLVPPLLANMYKEPLRILLQQIFLRECMLIPIATNALSTGVQVRLRDDAMQLGPRWLLCQSVVLRGRVRAIAAATHTPAATLHRLRM